MSHSSRSHGSAVHQSPDVRQGPARSRILPRMPSAAMKLGWPDARATRAAGGGRNMRRESWKEKEGRPGGRPRTRGSAPPKAVTRKASGRCVSINAGEPTRPSPTIDWMRARVSSSFTGSGVTGTNRPLWAACGFTGSMATRTCTMGAAGECAARSSCSSFRNALVSSDGTGSRNVRWSVAWVPSFRRSRSSLVFHLRAGVHLHAAEQHGIPHGAARENAAAGADGVDGLAAAVFVVEGEFGGRLRIASGAQGPFPVIKIERGLHRAQVHIGVVVGVDGADVAPVSGRIGRFAGNTVALEVVGEHLRVAG